MPQISPTVGFLLKTHWKLIWVACTLVFRFATKGTGSCKYLPQIYPKKIILSQYLTQICQWDATNLSNQKKCIPSNSIRCTSNLRVRDGDQLPLYLQFSSRNLCFLSFFIGFCAFSYLCLFLSLFCANTDNSHNFGHFNILVYIYLFLVQILGIWPKFGHQSLCCGKWSISETGILRQKPSPVSIKNDAQRKKKKTFKLWHKICWNQF